MENIIQLENMDLMMNATLVTTLSKKFYEGLCRVKRVREGKTSKQLWTIKLTEKMMYTIRKEIRNTEDIEHYRYLNVIVNRQETNVYLEFFNEDSKEIKHLDNIRSNKVLKIVNDLR